MSKTLRRRPEMRRLVLASAIMSACMGVPVFAQQTEADTEPKPEMETQPAAEPAQSAAPAQPQEATELDTIVVTGGLRGTLRKSLDVKRETTVVSDALMGEDIGSLPDLSIAESLERITGVAGDRFKGGAAELSIRGLGPFLGTSILNGRQITSGSDGRDVNFGQFPSELIGGAIVYKTQQASFIEGAISGIIELQTLKPLDYGKQRIQVQGLGGYSDYEDRVDGGDSFSSRYTASYVDQFETGIGKIGVAVGVQSLDDTAPEDFFTTSSTFRPCNTIGNTTGLPGTPANVGVGDCRYQVDPVTGAPTGPSPTYFVSNQYVYRAMRTQFERDALMANVQWKPNAQWDINLDMQYSDRFDVEDRANLIISDGRRNIIPRAISDTGALLAWSGQTRLENQSTYRTREDEYLATGLNVAWFGERLQLTGDLAYNQSKRRQDELDMRIRTNARVFYDVDTRGVDIPNWTFTNVQPVVTGTGLPFDLNDHRIYTEGARARRQIEKVSDKIFSAKFDGTYLLDSDIFRSLDFGLRYADRERIRDDGIDRELPLQAGGYLNPAAVAARRDTFLVADLYQGAETNMDGFSWATWDTQALWQALTGGGNAGEPLAVTLSPDDTDVTESTYALYGQANFQTELFGIPAYGNFGLRAVRTRLTSRGYRAAYTTVPVVGSPGLVTATPVPGTTTVAVENNEFWNILPSANLIFELSDDQLLRLAAYKAVARPDLESMSNGLGTSTDPVDSDLQSLLQPSGNPQLEPVESLNFDVSYELYLNEDTAFSTTFYAKQLQTGFKPEQLEFDVVVNGVEQTLIGGRSANSNDSSELIGVEVAAQHVFSGLPKPFNGLGVQGAWNYADSDFEFEDPTVVFDAGTQRTNALADFTEPANISGFSSNTGNFTVFWENDWASLRLAYKTRSTYFKPFRNTSNRYALDSHFLDFSAAVKLSDAWEVRLQVLNITDEPNRMNRPVPDSLAETSYTGPRYLLGLRGRF